ncbi:hypothetical protein [Micromonospora sp. NPDC023633]|uniref:hypothetical protein n=1 Tax=Micromonospora sp. NPDC023633 TaxID=3154320 RepID=UPI0033E44D84
MAKVTGGPGELNRPADQRPPPVVDVNVARLTFLGSTILSVLVAAHRNAVNAGGTLTCSTPPATSAAS